MRDDDKVEVLMDEVIEVDEGDDDSNSLKDLVNF